MSNLTPFDISRRINNEYIAHLNIETSMVDHSNIIPESFDCVVPINRIPLNPKKLFMFWRFVPANKHMFVFEFFSKIYMLAYMNKSKIIFVMTKDCDMYFCCSKSMYDEIAPVCNI